MIKVSVMYPNGEGSKFDMDYYLEKHIPLVKDKVGSACKGINVDEGLAGGEPGAPATYASIGHLLFETVEAFQGAFGPHAEVIMADLPNFTNISPTIQISEVKL